MLARLRFPHELAKRLSYSRSHPASAAGISPISLSISSTHRGVCV